MAKKKAGLARPVRVYETIDSPMVDQHTVPNDYRLTEKRKVKDDASATGEMIEVEVEVGVLSQAQAKHPGMTLVRVKTERVRHLGVKAGRMLNARRTKGWTFRRTFIFE